LSDASVFRRSVPFLIVLGFIGCSSATHTSSTPSPRSGLTDAATLTVSPGGLRKLCLNTGTGSDDPDFPVICIDNTTDPSKPVIITDKVTGLRVNDTVGGEKNNPVHVTWYTTNPATELHVRFKTNPSACVKTKVWCSPNGGHCRVATKKQTAGDKSCEYDVFFGTVQVLDPIIIVQPCCAALEPIEEP
jgi:hypothetical protein